MKAPLSFHSFIGNRPVVKILLRAVAQDRLPHALIFAGPEGVGKRTLGLLLAQQLNCLQTAKGDACDDCMSCRKIMLGTHPDVRLVQPDGAFIKIDQVRDLIAEIAYQPFEARYRVVIFDGADRMRAEAANCLLKTLEEPPSRTILILVTQRPYALLTTIRSRARLLQFGPVPEEEISNYLAGNAGRSPEDARMAAAFSNGSLGAALTFDVAQNREVRDQSLRFVSLLLRREEFSQASTLAAAVVKDKELFQAWLDMTATLLQDVYYAQTAPRRMCQRDIIPALAGLAETAPRAAVLAAIDAVKNLRGVLQLNINRQLALEALFLAALRS